VPLLYLAAPWAFGLKLDRAVLRRAFGFGAAFQATNLTSLARDNINSLLGGTLFGPQVVGYLNWGMNLAQTCSHSFVLVVGRVSFPAFSRLHENTAERERLLIRTLAGLNLITWPLLAMVATLGSPIVAHLYGEAWRPALPALWAYSCRFAATNTTSILVSYLNATGRPGASFRVTAVWTAVEWALALVLIPHLGFLGIAAACGVGAVLPVIWLLVAIREEVAIPYARAFLLPLGLAAVMAAGSCAVAPFITTGVLLLVVLAALSTLLLAVLAYLEREALNHWYQRFKASRVRPLEPRVAVADNRE
jgi:lipopolysaccharide exporter